VVLKRRYYGKESVLVAVERPQVMKVAACQMPGLCLSIGTIALYI
jgi:hypothetical protein